MEVEPMSREVEWGHVRSDYRNRERDVRQDAITRIPLPRRPLCSRALFRTIRFSMATNGQQLRQQTSIFD
jgi:hypothetical protein